MSDVVHIMVDLETLGVEPTAPVLEIGVASQGTEVGDVMQTWSTHVSINSQKERPIEQDTLAWWLGDEARQQWLVNHLAHSSDQPNLVNGVLGLGRRIEAVTNGRQMDYLIWFKGSMDLAILDNACKTYVSTGFLDTFGLAFRKVRDFRTILDIGHRKGIVTTNASLPSGAVHSAEEDAKSQLTDLMKIWEALGL